MSDIKSWSNSAGGNTSSSPNGFPEGMPPSGVNDAARETMAAIRRWYEAAEWIDWGYTPTYATASKFTLAGDRTTAFHVQRRVKALDGSNTLYGTISDSTYTANTAVTVTLDSGSLTSSLSAISTGILAYTNPAIPNHFSSTTYFTNGIEVSQTATFSNKVNLDSDVAIRGGGGFSCSTTASFTSRVVLNNGIDVSATATFSNGVKLPNTGTALGSIFKNNIINAWANFAGSNGAIAGQFNVGSVSRSATGRYIVNFTSAMPSANYGVLAIARGSSNQNTMMAVVTAPTTGSIKLGAYLSNDGVAVDPTTVFMTVVGG